MIPDYPGLKLGSCLGIHPGWPQVTEPRPEQPVNGPQPRAPAGLSLQDRSLMTKRRVLNLERRLALQA